MHRTGTSRKDRKPPNHYDVFLERRAAKQLQRLDESSKRRMIEALRELSERGLAARLDLKKLKGYESQYRLRVGSYRILFEFQKPRTIIVYAILPRKTAYRNIEK